MCLYLRSIKSCFFSSTTNELGAEVHRDVSIHLVSNKNRTISSTHTRLLYTHPANSVPCLECLHLEKACPKKTLGLGLAYSIVMKKKTVMVQHPSFFLLSNKHKTNPNDWKIQHRKHNLFLKKNVRQRRMTQSSREPNNSSSPCPRQTTIVGSGHRAAGAVHACRPSEIKTTTAPADPGATRFHNPKVLLTFRTSFVTAETLKSSSKKSPQHQKLVHVG